MHAKNGSVGKEYNIKIEPRIYVLVLKGDKWKIIKNKTLVVSMTEEIFLGCHPDNRKMLSVE